MSRSDKKRHGRRAGWSEAHVRRLFWRAGFGATPREACHWARRGKAATIRWLLNGGVAPVPGSRRPLSTESRSTPVNEWGHDVLWWLHLSLADSDPEAPNENFSRELMELYSLGRGYSERRPPPGGSRAHRVQVGLLPGRRERAHLLRP